MISRRSAITATAVGVFGFAISPFKAFSKVVEDRKCSHCENMGRNPYNVTPADDNIPESKEWCLCNTPGCCCMYGVCQICGSTMQLRIVEGDAAENYLRYELPSLRKYRSVGLRRCKRCNVDFVQDFNNGAHFVPVS